MGWPGFLGMMLVQEKADLHRRAQVLETTQPGSEVCEIHVAAAESHAHKQDQETVLMMDKSTALREVTTF